MAATKPALIALDWGTSSLRAYLMGLGGAVIETRRLPLGLMHVPGRDFAAVLEQAVGDWRRDWPGNHLRAGPPRRSPITPKGKPQSSGFSS